MFSLQHEWREVFFEILIDGRGSSTRSSLCTRNIKDGVSISMKQKHIQFHEKIMQFASMEQDKFCFHGTSKMHLKIKKHGSMSTSWLKMCNCFLEKKRHSFYKEELHGFYKKKKKKTSLQSWKKKWGIKLNLLQGWNKQDAFQDQKTFHDACLLPD